MMDSGELEEKRLHAMEQLYGKGEVHENEASTHKWSNFIMRCLMMILGALIYTIGLDLF